MSVPESVCMFCAIPVAIGSNHCHGCYEHWHGDPGRCPHCGWVRPIRCRMATTDEYGFSTRPAERQERSDFLKRRLS